MILSRYLFCVCWPSVGLLWQKCLFRPSAHFSISLVFLVLSCIHSLYASDINPLLDISFANIFSYSVGCLYFLLLWICLFYIFHRSGIIVCGLWCLASFTWSSAFNVHLLYSVYHYFISLWLIRISFFF